MYVLTNNSHYCTKNKTNGIAKTMVLHEAKRYETEEDAEKQILKAPTKLRSYHVQELSEDENETFKVLDDPLIKKHKRTKINTDKRKSTYKKSKGYCCLCGKFIDYEDFTIDHIIPVAKGGTNNIDNLQCACKVCNKIKTDVLPDEFTDKITEMIIYSMNQKYNKIIGRKILGMLITSNLHRLVKQK